MTTHHNPFALRTLIAALTGVMISMAAAAPASAEIREYDCPATLEYSFESDFMYNYINVAGGAPIVRLESIYVSGALMICLFEDEFARADGWSYEQYFAFLVDQQNTCPSDATLFVKEPSFQIPGWHTVGDIELDRYHNTSTPQLIAPSPLYVDGVGPAESNPGVPGCVYDPHINGTTWIYDYDSGICEENDDGDGFRCADTLQELNEPVMGGYGW